MFTKSRKFLFNSVLSIAIAGQISAVSAAELGSFLARLEGAYSTTSSKLESSTATGTTYNSTINNSGLKGYSGGIGFGYVASEDIWTDITLSYASEKTKVDATKTNITKVSDTNIAAMLNGYYGFNMGNKFSPYVMIGFGPALSKSTITVPTTGMVINSNPALTDIKGEIKSKNTTYLAYQGGFGLSLKAMESIAFDIGYRIGNHQVGKYTITSTVSGASNPITLKPKSVLKHSILFGVNIAF